MAIVRVSNGTIFWASSVAVAAAANLAKPASVANGDVLVAEMHTSSVGTGIDGPAGWVEVISLVNSSNCIVVWIKVITNAVSEPATYAFTNNGIGVAAIGGLIHRYTGVDTTNPQDATAATSSYSNSTTATCPSVTTGNADAMILGFVGQSSNVSFTSAVLTEIYDQEINNASATLSGAGGQVAQAVAGASGTKAWTASVKGAGPTATMALRALPPAVPAITQAAYRFYADGTETGSTALAAQNTSPTVNTPAGDVNLQLRVLLQSTNANAIPSTDDFAVQWEKNGNAVWNDTEISGVLPYASANLTEAAATTNRLTGGSGTFTAGKVTEDGVVDNMGWTGNNFTELLFSLTVKQVGWTAGDTLRFRVTRNGGSTADMTYTQTPTVLIGSGGGTAHTQSPTDTEGLTDTNTRTISGVVARPMKRRQPLTGQRTNANRGSYSG